MIYKDLGIAEYSEVWKIQEELFNNNVEAKKDNRQTENYLIFCEHHPVITIGKSGKDENLLFSKDYLKDKGISLFKIDRGGDTTFHGPGQLVVYPIFDLETFHIGLRQYINILEDIMIRLLSSYGIQAGQSDNATGVWLDTDKSDKIRKIGAIGVRSSRYITMHGLALNINTDMSCFSLINPCGFVDRGVTSMQRETGETYNMEEIKLQMKKLFEVFFVF